jgi:DNA-binding CsgD family transcriptional regulator
MPIGKPAPSREQQIILIVMKCLSNKDIGRRLDLTEGTVKVHLHNIYRKCRVNNRTALAAMAIKYREGNTRHTHRIRGLHLSRQRHRKNLPISGEQRGFGVIADSVVNIGRAMKKQASP